ncbi:MAG: transporter [Myxococcales bacterium]|nr:transporter [Myxococcales bacterium]
MLAVLVAALGYFVDIYDLILFGMVRKTSLVDLGLCNGLEITSQACKDVLTDKGIYLLNMQMGGMLVGGILWGVIGDKRGRLSVLFGSITLYSIANIANGMVHSLDSYATWRLIAGIGLAGELGAGVTLVSELMGRERRGIGTTLVAAVGVSGGLVAGLIGGAFPGVPHPDWRVAYFIGGGLGLALLVLRIGVVESGMFHSTAAKKDVARGQFFALFTNRRRFLRYLAIIAVGIPVWYVIGIPFTFSDAIGAKLGLSPAPNPATSLFFCYGGCSIGGFGCGLLSQYLRSRKRALGFFLGGVVVSMTLYFTIGGTSSTVFYALCLLGGAATGYWAVFVSTAAEMFGTNLRATVTTTVPNFVRGSVPLLTMSFKAIAPSQGVIFAAVAVGAGTIVVACIGLWSLPETFGVDLDYHETDTPELPKATAVG